MFDRKPLLYGLSKLLPTETRKNSCLEIPCQTMRLESSVIVELQAVQPEQAVLRRPPTLYFLPTTLSAPCLEPPPSLLFLLSCFFG